jgi:hypothetical protein
MRKVFVLAAFVLIMAFSVNLSADPIQTTEQFWSAIFDEGDLKLAFSQIATVDQDYIKMNAPEVYNFIMGDMGGIEGDFAAIFQAFQKIILNTIGKVVKVEDINLGEKTAEGQEVRYSLTMATDIESYMEISKWVQGQEGQFNNPSDTTPMMEKVSKFIKSLSQKLDNISFKTSISINSFVTVIQEEGQEKVLLNLALAEEKLKWLEGMD